MISVFGNENRLRPLMKQPCEKADFRLKIKNSYDTPIYVEGTAEGRTLTFTIYGKETRPANRTISSSASKAAL